MNTTRQRRNESEIDHAWRTVPRDRPVGSPPASVAAARAAVARVRSLAMVRDIVTVTCYSACIIALTVILAAWFLDLKV